MGVMSLCDRNLALFLFDSGMLSRGLELVFWPAMMVQPVGVGKVVECLPQELTHLMPSLRSVGPVCEHEFFALEILLLIWLGLLMLQYQLLEHQER